MTTAASTVSLNELVALYEEALGRRLDVRYLPVEKWLRRETVDLPANMHIAKEYAERFPRGLDQLWPLVADLEAGVALGAFDFSTWDQRQHLDLVKALDGRVLAPKRIEELIEETWKPIPS
ncbi:hypothetical protein F4809DRAFT_604437 [Biscogniauxia mediterranea]|nr:hypothetical protein F4809DRAFT_604437 [Biscogniauxia mediterranea]